MQESTLNVKLPSPKESNLGNSNTIRSHRFPMELVHLNKSEVSGLDKAQGGPSYRGKYKEYSKLGHAFMHPEAIKALNKASRQYHANGGRAKIDEMRKHGRFGDTEIAYMPKHVADRLDRLMGGTCRNPKTGKREYFLGALMGALPMVGGLLSKIPVVGKALGGMFGGGGGGGLLGGLGGLLGGAAKAAPAVMRAAKPALNFAQQAVPQMMAMKQAYDQQKAQGPQMGPDGQPMSFGNTMMNAGMNGVMNMLQAKQQGKSWQDAAGEGFRGGYQNMTNSPFAKNAMQNYSQQQQQNGPSRFQQMADKFSPVINAGREAYNRYQDTGNMQDSLVHGGYRGAMEGMDRYGGQYAKPMKNVMRAGMEGYQQGGMRGAMQRGGMRAMGEGINRMPNQDMRAGMRHAYDTYQDTGDMGQSAMRGMGTYARRRGYDDMGEGFQSAAGARGRGMDMANTGMSGMMGAMDSYSRRRYPDDNYGDSMRNMYGDNGDF